jgi:hypothetical protein
VMAKRIKFPHVDPFKPDLHTYSVSSKAPRIAGMLAYLWGVARHDVMPGDEAVTYILGRRPSQGVKLQHDGETATVPAQSRLTIQREATPYYLVTR